MTALLKRLTPPAWLRVALLFMLAGFLVCAALSALYSGGLPEGFRQLCYCIAGLAALLAVWFCYDLKGVSFQ